MKNQEKIYDKNNALIYRKMGDYFIPDLAIPEEDHAIGRWGHLHRDYLKEHKSVQYSVLITTSQLWQYLSGIDLQAKSKLGVIVEQMQKAEGVTEALKEREPMAWVQQMNSIRNRAEEIVLHELIYM